MASKKGNGKRTATFVLSTVAAQLLFIPFNYLVPHNVANPEQPEHLWFIWCFVVSLVSLIISERKKLMGTIRWILCVIAINISTLVVITVVDLILQFEQYSRDAEARELLPAVVYIFLIYGFAAIVLSTASFFLVTSFVRGYRKR
jgi:hypothetical protein